MDAARDWMRSQGRLPDVSALEKSAVEIADLYRHKLFEAVYFIDEGQTTTPIKIGFHASPLTIAWRLSALQSDNPRKLRLIHVEAGSFALEQFIHRTFAECRIRGEWFEQTQPLLAFIETAKKRGIRIALEIAHGIAGMGSTDQ